MVPCPSGQSTITCGDGSGRVVGGSPANCSEAVKVEVVANPGAVVVSSRTNVDVMSRLIATMIVVLEVVRWQADLAQLTLMDDDEGAGQPAGTASVTVTNKDGTAAAAA
jgi:hypothetical protein